MLHPSWWEKGEVEARWRGREKRRWQERGRLLWRGGATLSRGEFLCTTTQIRKSLTLYWLVRCFISSDGKERGLPRKMRGVCVLTVRAMWALIRDPCTGQGPGVPELLEGVSKLFSSASVPKDDWARLQEVVTKTPTASIHTQAAARHAQKRLYLLFLVIADFSPSERFKSRLKKQTFQAKENH